LRSQEDIWDELIRYAKDYAALMVRTFLFDMEDYNNHEQFFTVGADTVYA